MRTTRAGPSRCSEAPPARAPRGWLAALLLALATTIFAAPSAAQGDKPPGARADVQDPQGDTFDPRLQRMQGKTVRSVAFWRLGRTARDLQQLDQATADSFVRGLLTRVGQPFEPRNIATDCIKLWTDRRMVVEAYADGTGDDVAINFLVVREVEVFESVEFKGLDNLDRATVDGLLGLYPDRQVTRVEADAMRKVLLSRYRHDGYAHCSVTFEERSVGEDRSAPATPPPPTSEHAPRRVLVFVIDEGPKVTVRRVAFLGNASFPGDALFGAFGLGEYLVRDAHLESDPSHGLISGGPFSREVLDEDVDRLLLFYRSRGFLDATVDLASVTFTPDRSKVDISFVVVEGPRFRIRSLHIEHVTSTGAPLTEKPLYDPAEIAKELKLKPGDFYDHDRLRRDVQAIQDFYGRRGHPPSDYPGMNTVQSPCTVFTPIPTYGEQPEVDLTFKISEGVPKKLRDVVIRGNRFTRDHVIRRRMKVFPGKTIDMVEVNRSLRAIQQTRYFQDPASLRGPRLQLEPVPEQPDYVDIGLDVQDGPTGQLRWGVGVSTGQGIQGTFTFNKSNFDLWKPPSSLDPVTAIGEVLDNRAFHGGGQNLGLLLAPGDKYSQFQVTWIEPDVFRQYLDTWELRVSGRRVIRRLPDGYTSDILGAEVGLSHNFTDNFNLGFVVREESVKIKDLAPDATSLAYDAEGRTELRGLRLTARYRDYDDVVKPTSGYEISFEGNLVGGWLGGEESLTKFTNQDNFYFVLKENEMQHRTVLHLANFFGIANEFGSSDDVFITERFYLGGYNLRGFDYRAVGPKQFGRPVGGEATWHGSVEVYFPLVATRLEGEVRDRELLRWLVFTDIGVLGLDINDSTFRELRVSSGIGLRIEIPVLEIPIALDLGWPWIYQETDDRRQLYFSISR